MSKLNEPLHRLRPAQMAGSGYAQPEDDVVAEAQALAALAAVQHGRLLAFVLSCLPATDWEHAKPLVQGIWKVALERGDLFTEPDSVDPESQLAGSLAFAARTVLRQYLSPATTTQAPAAEEPVRRRPLTPVEIHFLDQYAVRDSLDGAA